MSREANFALGSWYQHQDEDDRKPYVALVRKLAESGSRRDRETAFFLIRHSELTYRKEGVVVNKAFRLPLEKIFLDTRLDWLVRDHYEMFELNLDPYHLQRLQERRQEILAAHQGEKQRF